MPYLYFRWEHQLCRIAIHPTDYGLLHKLANGKLFVNNQGYCYTMILGDDDQTKKFQTFFVNHQTWVAVKDPNFEAVGSTSDPVGEGWTPNPGQFWKSLVNDRIIQEEYIPNFFVPVRRPDWFNDRLDRSWLL